MKRLLEIFAIIVGSLITAFGINEFILPVHLMSGGLTGICIILYHFFGWKVGTQYFLFNIPLLILGYKYIGRKFSCYTLLAVISLSTFLNVIHIQKFFTSDTLLCAIFGGIVTSAGGAIVLRAGGSSGGLDIVARIVAKFKNVPIGKFSLVVNGLIVLASAYLYEVQTALYTLISIFTGSKTYETLLHHVDRITVMIITSKGDEVSQTITQAMGRGVTKWEASGAYTHSSKQVLLCVIVNVQLAELRQLVSSQDGEAFITVLPTQNVIGKFAQVW